MLELLLANHPLDCPVCDKGGECPLQDQAFSHGPGESRYVEQKRHYEKPIPISDHVLLDRERCILCDRCTRFADEVAGDKLIHFIDRGNDTQVATFPDEPFASYFSGNTVQICPVGALTAKPYRFKARPWDLEQAESTCTTCSVGCRISVQSSRDELLRYQGVDRSNVGQPGLAVRPRSLQLRGGRIRASRLGDAAWSAARPGWPTTVGRRDVDRANSSLARRRRPIGTPRWCPLHERGRLRLGAARRRARRRPTATPSSATVCRPASSALTAATIDEAATANTVILVGPDLKEELPGPVPALARRGDDGTTKIIEFSSQATGMTRYAWKSVRHAPGMPATRSPRRWPTRPSPTSSRSGDVVVVAGRSNLAVSEATALAAVRAALAAVPGAKVLPGAAARQRRRCAAARPRPEPTPTHDATRDTCARRADGKVDVLVLLGADPINDCPDADLARRALAGARRIISIDTFPSESTQARRRRARPRPRSPSSPARRRTSRVVSPTSARRSRRTARLGPTG